MVTNIKLQSIDEQSIKDRAQEVLSSVEGLSEVFAETLCKALSVSCYEESSPSSKMNWVYPLEDK